MSRRSLEDGARDGSSKYTIRTFARKSAPKRPGRPRRAGRGAFRLGARRVFRQVKVGRTDAVVESSSEADLRPRSPGLSRFSALRRSVRRAERAMLWRCARTSQDRAWSWAVAAGLRAAGPLDRAPASSSSSLRSAAAFAANVEPAARTRTGPPPRRPSRPVSTASEWVAAERRETCPMYCSAYAWPFAAQPRTARVCASLSHRDSIACTGPGCLPARGPKWIRQRFLNTSTHRLSVSLTTRALPAKATPVGPDRVRAQFRLGSEHRHGAVEQPIHHGPSVGSYRSPPRRSVNSSLIRRSSFHSRRRRSASRTRERY